MSRRTWWLWAASIAALALAASANSIVNGFAYDDVWLIQRPDRLHTLEGWWREFAHTYWSEEVGGDGYRPLTIIAFRLEWWLGGGSPMPFHVVNVVLHVAGAVSVFWLMGAVLPLAAAWVAAAFYAVHPVHVEAIANVVGQSELYVALLLSLTAALYLHARLAGQVSTRRWIVIGALYFVGCLFKEHMIVLPALLGLAELTIIQDKTPWPRRIAALRPAYLGLTAVAFAYLWARSMVVLEGLGGFKPFMVFQALELSTPDRILTMVGASTEWLRLFLWPARLMTEYAPQYLEVAQGVSISLLPGLLVLLGTLGIAIASWRLSPATTFGIGWLVLTLLPASNFIIPAGFIIAERTLLTPSMGAMMAVGSAIPAVYVWVEAKASTRWLAGAAVALLLALGIGRSVTRNRVWRSDEALFRQAIIDAPESYRSHFMLATHLFQNQRKVEAEGHAREALRLFPYDPLMSYALAEQYRAAGMCEPAMPLYRAQIMMLPDAKLGRMGLAWCLMMGMQLEEAKTVALDGVRNGGSVTIAHAIITTSNQAKDSLNAKRLRDSKTPAPATVSPRPR